MGEQISYSVSEAIESTLTDRRLEYFDIKTFSDVLSYKENTIKKLQLFADLARFNTLYMIARAGSGHLGSSFSSIDIMSNIYINHLKEKDRFFSSKGHDSPGLYSVQIGLGILPFQNLHKLRRLGGLPGHPDLNTPGSITNTGSLGMGISKAKGFLFSDTLRGEKKSRIFVLTGDGELQEGQFWESLISAANNFDERLHVIIDHNKIQSDTYVTNVSDLGDLRQKLKSFGWSVTEGNGHDFKSIDRFVNDKSGGKPKIHIAHTIKGKGVSFMEHTSMKYDENFYKYHSGAPTKIDYEDAVIELKNKIHHQIKELGLTKYKTKKTIINAIENTQATERLIQEYSSLIVKHADLNTNIVALDADLILDTGLIEFSVKFPERFIECGIAEQDMVSQAGTLASSGLLPIVHSFSCFLTSRASEQIYNNCTQGSKIVYVGSLAGVIPAGPGHSHQAVRDVTAMSSMPGITIVEPINSTQLKKVFNWAINKNKNSTYIRLTSVPIPIIETSQENLEEGTGEVLKYGTNLVVIVSSPILTEQAIKAALILENKNISVKVINTLWLNKINYKWYEQELTGINKIITLENHYSNMGMGNYILTELAVAGLLYNKRSLKLGLESLPKSGQKDEVLEYHQLDCNSIAKKIEYFHYR